MHFHPLGWAWPSFYVADSGVVAAFLSSTQYGQAAIGLLVAFVGFFLNRKTKQIHVLVNSQMSDALKRIALLETKLGLRPGEAIPAPQIVTPSTEPEPDTT